MILIHQRTRNSSSRTFTRPLRADRAMSATLLPNDRGAGMNLRTKAVIAVLSVMCLCLAPQADAETAKKAAKTTKATKTQKDSKESKESKESKFRLKPGAQQKVCLTCHADFEARLKKPFIHTPVKTGCTACHSPHTSKYPKQLSAEANRICLTCHSGILPKDARSSHKVALEGTCMLCHDPHSSDNKNNLPCGRRCPGRFPGRRMDCVASIFPPAS